MEEDSKLACNRAPFETTDSCDRGDVDITVFSELPLCESIDPPPSAWGPPTFDFPVVPIQPPPCACINIEASTVGVIEDRSNVELNIDFRASSDCCEGNYKADVDIKIPCIPFDIVNGSKSHSIEINTNCSPDMSPSGTVNLGITTDSSCNVIINPRISLNIPRPPKYVFNAKMNIETLCGLSSAFGSFDIESSGECEKTITAQLNLQLPKPPKYRFDTEFSMETVCGLSSALGSFDIESSGDSCEKNLKAKLHLLIPRPPRYTFETEFSIETICGISSAFGSFDLESSGDDCDKNIKAKMNLVVPKPITYDFEMSYNINRVCMVTSSSPDLGSFWLDEIQGSDCSKKIVSHMRLDIPCIMFNVQGASSDHSIDISTDCAESMEPQGTLNLGLTFPDCCTIQFNPKLQLKIPRPPKYTFNTEFSLETVCGLSSAFGSFDIESSGDSCEKNLKSKLHLLIPRPPKYTFNTEFSLETVCGLSSAFGSFDIESSGDSCEKNFKAKLNLLIPKPPRYTFETEFSMETVCGLSSAFGSFDIESSGDSCEKNLKSKLHLLIPRPPKYTFNTEFSLETVCGLSSAFGSFDIESSGDSCEKNFKAKLNLLIPKPPRYSFKTDFSFETICGLTSAFGSFDFLSSGDSCEKNMMAKLSLKIPRPIKYTFDGSYHIKRSCRVEAASPDLGSFWLEEMQGSEDCSRKIVSHMRLDIPCIMFSTKGASSAHSVEIAASCGTEKPSGTLNLGLTFPDCCTMQFNPQLKLNIPKPPRYKFSTELSLDAECGIKSPEGLFVIESSGDACEKTLTAKLKLKLPHTAKLNISDDVKNINVTGIGGTGQFGMGVMNDECGHPIRIDPWFNIDIPCPFEALFIHGDSSVASGMPYITTSKIYDSSATDIDSYAAGECEASFEVHLVWPSTYTGTVKFLKGIIFNGASFVPVVGHAEFKYGLCIDADSDSPYISIPTSRHVNKCCDVDDRNKDDEDAIYGKYVHGIYGDYAYGTGDAPDGY